MAHQLATANGKAATFHVASEGTPWHGLGTPLDNPATSAEAITAAGLGWTVSLHTLALASDGRAVHDRMAVLRDDTSHILGTVGRQWTPIQNTESFDFLDGVVGEGIRYHTAGALDDGRRVWMLAKLPESMRIGAKDDVVDQYLLLSNNHDGRGALRAFFTPIRVVCANTLAVAERAATNGKVIPAGVTVRHTGNVLEKVDQARHVLGIAERYYADFAARARTLAATPVKAQALADYFAEVVPPPEDPTASKRAANRANEVHAALTGLFEGGRGNDRPGTRGTLWAAYNAVTEYVDHHRPTRAKGIEAQRADRLDAAWFGEGMKTKARAFEFAFARASVN